MGELIKALIAKGWTEDEATKTYNRWYAWLMDVTSKKILISILKQLSKHSMIN